MNFCPNCGSPTKTNAIFCAKCGYRLENNEIIISKNNSSTVSDVKPKQSETIIEKKNQKETKSKKNSLLLFLFIGCVIICIIANWVLDNKETSNEFTSSITQNASTNNNLLWEEMINSIKSDPNKTILVQNQKEGYIYYTINDISLTCYKYDLHTNNNLLINLEILNENKELSAWIMYLQDAFFVNELNSIIFIGGNGANSFMAGDYALSLNLSNEKLSEICFAREIKRSNNYLITEQMELLVEGSAAYENEYYYFNQIYNFKGNIIDGKAIRGEGYIGKYSIEMSLHTLNGKITGWYKYAGHTNYMTIKGTIQNDNSFSFVEYNDKGESFGTFTGHADFENQTLNGNFQKGNTILDFRISKKPNEYTLSTNDKNSMREQTIKWNNNHTLLESDLTALGSLYMDQVLFYGQTLSSQKCIQLKEETIRKYDTYHQQLVSEISYNIIDDNLVKCSFTKHVTVNGKGKDYEAYLIFAKIGSQWLIQTESDTQTDAYFERLKNNKTK